MKRPVFIVLRKRIEDMYAVYLPKKAHPWVYISLEIDPRNVDVNIHPTKHEVRFLHEDVIIEKIEATLDEKLAASNSSRTFYIQAKLPKVDLTKELVQEILPDTQETDKTTKIAPKDMIRTNVSDQKLEKFNFTREAANKSDLTNNDEKDRSSMNLSKGTEVGNCGNKEPGKIINIALEHDDLDEFQINKACEGKILKNANTSAEVLEKNLVEPVENENQNNKAHENGNASSDEIRTPVSFKSYSVNEVQLETKLLSVLTLRKEVEDTYHEGLRQIVSNSIFVGCVDESSALIQSGVSLYICHTQKLV